MYLDKIDSLGLMFLPLLFLFFGCNSGFKPIPDTKKIETILKWNKELKDTSNPEESLRSLDSAISGFSLSPTEKLLIMRRKRNIYFYDRANLLTALDYADSAILLIEDKHNVWSIDDCFEAYFSKADICYALDRYIEAFKYFGKAKALIPKDNPNPSIIGCYNYRIAFAHYAEEQFLDAAEHFKLSLKSFVLLDSSQFEFVFRRQEVLNDIGLCYENAGLFDSALNFYSVAVNYIKKEELLFPTMKVGIKEAISVIAGNIGSAYAKKKIFDSARQYLIESIKINESVNRNVHDRIFNILKLADVDIEEAKFQDAIRLLAVADTLTGRLQKNGIRAHDLEIDQRIAEVKSKYYTKVGDYKNAFQFLEDHHKDQEIRWRNAHKLMLNNIENGIDHYDHTRQIALLEKNVQISKKNAIIYILLVIIAVTISVVVYLSLRAFKVKHQQLKTETLNIVSANALKEEELKQKNWLDELNYMALIENTEDFFWSVDVNLNFLAFNRVFSTYTYNKLGVYPEVGKPDVIKDFDVPLYTKVLEGYNTVLAGNIYHVRIKGLSLDKRKPDLEVTMHPIYDDKGAIVGVSCCRKDITEYVRLINALKAHNIQLRDIAWLQSHKLRGPLSSLMGIGMVLNDQEISLDAKQQLIVSASEKMHEIDLMIREIVEMTNKYNLTLREEEETGIV